LKRTEKLRKVPKFSLGEVVLGLSHKLVKLASGGIAFHLPIPIIILEWMQQCLQLATLVAKAF